MLVRLSRRLRCTCMPSARQWHRRLQARSAPNVNCTTTASGKGLRGLRHKITSIYSSTSGARGPAAVCAPGDRRQGGLFPGRSANQSGAKDRNSLICTTMASRLQRHISKRSPAHRSLSLSPRESPLIHQPTQSLLLHRSRVWHTRSTTHSFFKSTVAN
ncbi:hypothetical protein BU26DRAFT_51446 [Trematosphaeria pertusa]|uniref:Uncharacterized protein n=1 Tax=Trematosphaeria pertusa TaxID=390896 RepID=A0A6A6I9E5_9PLEO|nr:uncharacterized protein BU26DRAFT_51446 [Trematosphaeria pertusa]KAF2246698.1 hypothetical protein BU26DRAFT_51446 [Trematosphaeria pertusa]